MEQVPRWKQLTIARLAREIGALAEIIVDDVLYDLGLDSVDTVTPRQVMEFLARLQRELPPSLDQGRIIRDITNEILPAATS